ncbi:MAG: heparinase II/III family protein, partial [Pyrinomonadaceae bacterium]
MSESSEITRKSYNSSSNKAENIFRRLPPDEEFFSYTLKNLQSAEEIKKAFYSQSKFFFSCADKERFLRAYDEFLGQEILKSIVERAERVLAGKISLFGHENLDFGSPIDWHYEPFSAKRLELKPWDEFSDLSTLENIDVQVIWEFNRHQHFFTLGLAYWITEDEIFAETFFNHLESWMSQNPPGLGINWVSNFELSLRAISWLWAFRFFENSPSFNDAIFLKALKFLHLHAQRIENYLLFNPNTTCEALGLYYLSTQMPFFNESEKWRQVAK